MTWTKLSDDYCEKLEDAGVSRSARHLLTELYCWANRSQRDGLIPAHRPARISDAMALEADLDELRAAGFIELLEDGSWSLPWDDQESAEVVRARRDKATEKKRRQRRCAAGHHDQCPPSWRCRKIGDKGGDVPQGQAGGVPTLPTRPDPSRPEEDGIGSTQGVRCPHGHPIASDDTTSCSVCSGAGQVVVLRSRGERQ